MSVNFVALLLLCLNVMHLARGLATPPLDEANGRSTAEIVRNAKAADIGNYLNESCDPCENFHNFVCGYYARINPPTERALKSSFFGTIAKSLSAKFVTLLQAESVVDTRTDRKVKAFFNSCMHLAAAERTYKAKLTDIIHEFGQMPVLEGDAWREQEFDWLQTVAEIAHKYNIHIIVGYFIGVDTTENTVNRMRILLQDIPLHSASIYTEEVHAAIRFGHHKIIANNLMNFLGLEGKLANQTAKEIFEFEKLLFAPRNTTAEESGAMEETVDDDSPLPPNLVTIEEMQSNYYPQLDIKRLMQISFGSVPTDKVYDLIGDQVENIAMLMRRTPKRIVANYIYYFLLEQFMFAIPKDEAGLQKLCIGMTKSHFAKVLDNMVYRKYTSQQTEQEVNYLWHTIKSSFHDLLQSDKLYWMSEATRKYALEKLQGIRMEINSYQDSNFTEEFGLLQLHQDDYIENIKSILALKAIQTRAKLNIPPKPYDDSQVLSYSPVYIQTENLIKVPVSILQPYYLWSDFYPKALKFGTLGFLISHELIHGFDERGRTFDKTGNLEEWWDKDSSEFFTNQTECFAAQYHRYIYDGSHLPELASQAENTADNGGIRLSFNAYLRWYEDAVRSYESVDSELMPNLNYSNRQLFFISYGQLWCSATHPILRNFAASTDEHVPEKLRIIGPLSNLDEFSREFNCPVGSPMNPAKKCIIY